MEENERARELNSKLFNALVVEETEDGIFRMNIRKKEVKDLPEGDVLIRVRYSSLNYKDAMSATGNRGVTKKYPHTSGIDAAGEIEISADPRFATGDHVLVTGYDLGMNTSGGFEQYIRVPADWLVKVPPDLSLEETMIYGTAGFTAALCVHELTATVKKEDGRILVTGASGGVGSVAVAILTKLGYSVVGVTGKPDGQRFVKRLGAVETLGRKDILAESGRPLLQGTWAGVVDTVGGEMLACAIKSTKLFGTVTCCGNVASNDLPVTVLPFILRGVRLIGVSSQNCPMEHRLAIWNLLAGGWKIDALNELREDIGLDGLDHHVGLILKGEQKGRVVVDVDA